jgi:hypothetical protein
MNRLIWRRKAFAVLLSAAAVIASPARTLTTMVNFKGLMAIRPKMGPSYKAPMTSKGQPTTAAPTTAARSSK